MSPFTYGRNLKKTTWDADTAPGNHAVLCRRKDSYSKARRRRWRTHLDKSALIVGRKRPSRVSAGTNGRNSCEKLTGRGQFNRGRNSEGAPKPCPLYPRANREGALGARMRGGDRFEIFVDSRENSKRARSGVRPGTTFETGRKSCQRGNWGEGGYFCREQG